MSLIHSDIEQVCLIEGYTEQEIRQYVILSKQLDNLFLISVTGIQIFKKTIWSG